MAAAYSESRPNYRRKTVKCGADPQVEKNTFIIQSYRSFFLSNNKETHLHFKPAVHRVTLWKQPAAVSMHSDGVTHRGWTGGCQQDCKTKM